MIYVVQPPLTLQGEIAVPGDKSISHRALILNSIASGPAHVSHFLWGDDCRATVACLRALGTNIDGKKGERVTVHGVGMNGLREPTGILDARNSGTTMRLLAGLLAPQPFLSIITGDGSLRSRPMGRLINPLRLMGVGIKGRANDSLPPLVIAGAKVRPIHYALPVASAQVKSAILLAGLYAEGPTTVVEPMVTRDHTERLLGAMGVKMDIHMESRGGSRQFLTVYPPESLHPVDVDVPGDLSAAAFWLVAAAIHPRAHLNLTNVGINPTRAGIIEVLQSMGARLRTENQRLLGGEPVADIHIESSDLAGINIGGDLVPRAIDEIPLIAVAASLAKGDTVIRDASELRVKESDRLRTTASELTRLGARIEELPDGLVIHGQTHLKGDNCDSHGDHRLAMALGIAGLVARGETVIRRAQAAGVSYPDFWSDLQGTCGDDGS
ncbi:MAG: 3-phosphoshikimate 1-carboxyvinyltransferase [Chloroflexi bacterium]|nr:3-phosphoshikimate 1-carboxyvinyltransferase [Chloroflexota bacterium]